MRADFLKNLFQICNLKIVTTFPPQKCKSFYLKLSSVSNFPGFWSLSSTKLTKRSGAVVCNLTITGLEVSVFHETTESETGETRERQNAKSRRKSFRSLRIDHRVTEGINAKWQFKYIFYLMKLETMKFTHPCQGWRLWRGSRQFMKPPKRSPNSQWFWYPEHREQEKAQ